MKMTSKLTFIARKKGAVLTLPHTSNSRISIIFIIVCDLRFTRTPALVSFASHDPCIPIVDGLKHALERP